MLAVTAPVADPDATVLAVFFHEIRELRTFPP
jgi:hypothetical protein